jgi:hypothetical protein
LSSTGSSNDALAAPLADDTIHELRIKTKVPTPMPAEIATRVQLGGRFRAV